jgi:monothiol glutaredoxin
MSTPLSAIPALVSSAPVVVFIKGTADHPMCGFSRTVVRILQHLNVPFSSFDVLQDADLRQNLKTFSNWPTFPQLYVHGELIGGCDIAQEMFTSGELADLLQAQKILDVAVDPDDAV